MRSDGRGVRRIAGNELNGGTPAWSPDGREVAVAGADGLYVLSVDGPRKRRVLKEPFGFNPPTPSWSPDGRRISFVFHGIYALDIASGRLGTLAADTGSAYADTAVWSHNGRLAFSVTCFDAQGCRLANGLYVARDDGSHPRRIVRF